MAEILHYNIAMKENGTVKSGLLEHYMDEYHINSIHDIWYCPKLFWLANISSVDNKWELRAKTSINLCVSYLRGTCDGGCHKLHMCKQFLISSRSCQVECSFGLSHDIFDNR